MLCRSADDTEQGGVWTVPKRERLCQGRDKNVRQLPILQCAEHSVLPLCWCTGDLLCWKAKVTEVKIIAVHVKYPVLMHWYNMPVPSG